MTMKALLLLAATAAISQQPLDPTMSGAYPAYPAYLAVSCGGVKLETTESGLTAMVSATTTCPGSGRGSKPRHYLSCTQVSFASDRYTVLSRERVLYATWVSGQQGYSCPGL